MWGLITRIFAGQAPQPSRPDPVAALEADITRGIADARARRLSRPSRTERERFKRAQPKLAELKQAIAMQHVEF